MKKAVLDIGSNSIKYLLAEVQPHRELCVLKENIVTTRLAEGMEQTGFLGASSVEKTLNAVKKFVAEARSEGAERILALATSAVRDAKNRTEFETQFKAATDIDLAVLTGKQEAALVFQGAISDGSFPQRNVVVMDVGGGSAEWIFGNNGKILQQHSAPLGCVRMTERFLRGDPYSENSFQSLLQYLEENIRSIHPEFRLENRNLIITGGTACALADLDCSIDNQPFNVHRRVLEVDRMHALMDFLRSITQQEREKLPGIPPSRSDVVTAGAAVFAIAMSILGADKAMVSTRGLRFGALYI